MDELLYIANGAVIFAIVLAVVALVIAIAFVVVVIAMAFMDESHLKEGD